MDCENGTDIKEFVLLGLSYKPEHKYLFFLLFLLIYRGKNHLAHYFCDHQPLLQLSCSDTSVNEAVIFFE
ncbi:hypothetical protein E2320_016394, partial [Naja naja]